MRRLLRHKARTDALKGVENGALTHEPTDGRASEACALEIASVECARRAAAGLRGCNIERPLEGERVNGKLHLAGWALPEEAPLVRVEVRAEGELIGTIEDWTERQDVARAFPDRPWAGRSGFRGDIAAPAREGVLTVDAVLAGAECVTIGTLAVRPAVSRLDANHAAVKGSLRVESDALPRSPKRDYDLSEAEALDRVNCSPAVRWSKGIDDEPPPGTAWNRITSSSFFSPAIRPALAIERDDRIFAIGSCFARAVEGALKSLGMQVESGTEEFDAIPLASGATGSQHGFTNKYTPESIRNELRWALVPDQPFPAEALVELPDGTWQDPHAHPLLESASRDETVARHRRLSELTARIAACRIVVVTLGLIETFYDLETGLFTNYTPRLQQGSKRFRFRVLGYEEVMAALEDIHALLSEYGHRKTEIVVTVSPVPLQATFTGQDVVIANTHSKSLLRAAAAEFVSRHENVHYFPSYEIVTNSDRESVWMRDGRHVRNEFVRQIMDVFLETHLSTRLPGAAILVE